MNFKHPQRNELGYPNHTYVLIIHMFFDILDLVIYLFP